MKAKVDTKGIGINENIFRWFIKEFGEKPIISSKEIKESLKRFKNRYPTDKDREYAADLIIGRFGGGILTTDHGGYVSYAIKDLHPYVNKIKFILEKEDEITLESLAKKTNLQKLLLEAIINEFVEKASIIYCGGQVKVVYKK